MVTHRPTVRELADLFTIDEAAEASGYSRTHIQILARDNRIVGAVKYSGEWLVPLPLQILDLDRVPRDEDDLVPAKVAAEMTGYTRSAMYGLLRKGHVEGAVRTDAGWRIPLPLRLK